MRSARQNIDPHIAEIAKGMTAAVFCGVRRGDPANLSFAELVAVVDRQHDTWQAAVNTYEEAEIHCRLNEPAVPAECRVPWCTSTWDLTIFDDNGEPANCRKKGGPGDKLNVDHFLYVTADDIRGMKDRRPKYVYREGPQRCRLVEEYESFVKAALPAAIAYERELAKFRRRCRVDEKLERANNEMDKLNALHTQLFSRPLHSRTDLAAIGRITRRHFRKDPIEWGEAFARAVQRYAGTGA